MKQKQLLDKYEHPAKGIPVPTTWNEREWLDLKEFMCLIGEDKTATAIKRAVQLSKNLIANLSGASLAINLKANKQRSAPKKK